MEYIKEWLNNIAMYLIFIILLNMIIPNKSYKKYVSLVLGFIFILILLDPISKVFKSNFYDFSKEMGKYEQRINYSGSIHNESTSNRNTQEAILKIYRENIKVQLENLLEKNTPEVKIINMDLDIGSGEEDTGELKEIKLDILVRTEFNNKVPDRQIIEAKIKTLIKNIYSTDKITVHFNP